MIKVRSGIAAVITAAMLLGAGYSQSQTARPNILLIVADDLGYTDLGAFGGEIDTPNLDQLAQRGVQFSQFYVAPSCSPTRAMLLTGRDNHEVGLGNMAETMLPFQKGLPGYEGYLTGATTLATALGSAGYATLMSGKWHLGRGKHQAPDAHGFDRSYVLVGGAANHYGLDQGADWDGTPLQARYLLDGQPVIRPAGVFSDDYFTDRLLEFLAAPIAANTPFFAYLSFTSPHWPLQAPAELIEKYSKRYEEGPEALLSERQRKRTRLEILLPNEQPPAANTEAVLTSPDPQAARRMAIYAAMIDRMDQNVGRVLDFLRSTNTLDNTVVLFMSDNGADGISQAQLDQFLSRAAPSKALPAILLANDQLSKMGTGDSFIALGPEWASVASSPLRLYKGFMYDGGIRVPAIVAGPGVYPKGPVPEPVFVQDILPTVLEFAGVELADDSLPGQSWHSILSGLNSDHSSSNREFYWELGLKRAVRIGDWKAVYDGEGSVIFGSPDQYQWRLYNLILDPSEQHDLAPEQPDQLEHLVAKWWEYARQKGVAVPTPPPASDH